VHRLVFLRTAKPANRQDKNWFELQGVLGRQVFIFKGILGTALSEPSQKTRYNDYQHYLYFLRKS
jgi:hypothetical protein